VYGGTDGTTAKTDVAKYATGGDSWANTPQIGTVPAGRSGHSSIGTAAGIIYIFGGTSGGTYLNDVLKYNTIDCSTVASCNDNNLCTIDRCTVGSCDYGIQPQGTDCTDGIFCNGALDTCDANGVCVHGGDPCAGEAICNSQCNETARNCLAPVGTPCDDGLFCTAVDICTGGICRGLPGDPCAGNPVCNSTCSETTSSCASLAGVDCDDGLGCTLVDSCDGTGHCSGTRSPCAATDPCRQCQDSNGTALCISPAGTPCLDDGIFCNGPEVCNNGFCQSAGNPCTSCPDACLEGDKRCSCGTASSGPPQSQSDATRIQGTGVVFLLAAILSSYLL